MEQEKKNPINELMRATMEHVRLMADANTIVGAPIQADGVTMIPVSRMSVGVGGGGAEFSTNKGASTGSFGGGSGVGVKLDPVAFLIIQGGSVKLLPVAPPPATTIDRVIDTVPEVVDKVTGFIESQQEKKTKKAAEGEFAD